MAGDLKIHKLVAALPGTLEANSIYFVKSGAGVDVFVTNDTGTIVAYSLNGTAGVKGVATLTVAAGTPAGVIEHTETVVAANVSPTMTIMVAAYSDDNADENDPELLSIDSMSATAGSGVIAVEAVFSEPTSGPIKLRYMGF